MAHSPLPVAMLVRHVPLRHYKYPHSIAESKALSLSTLNLSIFFFLFILFSFTDLNIGEPSPVDPIQLSFLVGSLGAPQTHNGPKAARGPA